MTILFPISVNESGFCNLALAGDGGVKMDREAVEEGLSSEYGLTGAYGAMDFVGVFGAAAEEA